MQTRRKVKSEENDSRGSTGEKMTEEEKSRTDSLWQSFLSDTASSSKSQSTSKSKEESSNDSNEDVISNKDESLKKKKQEKLEETLPTHCEAEELSSNDKTFLKKSETESNASLKTENSEALSKAESTDTVNYQRKEPSEDTSSSEDNLKMDTPSSISTSADHKNSSKFSLLKTDKCRGLSSPLATLGSRKRNISNILNSTSKVTKLSTLEKSKRDWSQFKDEHKLEEELSTFNRGKNGYLEKQDFLQRTDLKQFEIEKELRNVERRKY